MTWNQTLLFYATAGGQFLLLALAVRHGLYRRLPLFTGYIGVLCAGSLTLLLVYRHYGFQSKPSYYGYWIVDGVLLVAQGLAISDLCRYELRNYRGVWALAWRILTAVAILTLLNAVVDSYGRSNWIPPFVLAISRDIAIASVTVLAALLLIRRYYGIKMESFESKLAGGMIFFSLIAVVNHTLMQNVLVQNAGRWHQVRSQLLPLYHLWDSVQSTAFVVALCIWCTALIEPLPAQAPTPIMLAAEVYADLTPAINLRLRSYSDRLLEMLKT